MSEGLQVERKQAVCSVYISGILWLSWPISITFGVCECIVHNF